jgi:hypothetical protein
MESEGTGLVKSAESLPPALSETQIVSDFSAAPAVYCVCRQASK